MIFGGNGGSAAEGQFVARKAWGGRRRGGAAPPRWAEGVAVAVLEGFPRKAMRISARGAVAEAGLGPVTCAGKLALAPPVVAIRGRRGPRVPRPWGAERGPG